MWSYFGGQSPSTWHLNLQDANYKVITKHTFTETQGTTGGTELKAFHDYSLEEIA